MKCRYATHRRELGNRRRILGWVVRCDGCERESPLTRRKADALAMAETAGCVLGKDRDVCGTCRAKET